RAARRREGDAGRTPCRRTRHRSWTLSWRTEHMKRAFVGAARLASVLFASACPPLSLHALAAELAGATLPDTLKAGEKTLKLNGLGLRKKAVFKVYVGGLYLESPSKD